MLSSDIKKEEEEKRRNTQLDLQNELDRIEQEKDDYIKRIDKEFAEKAKKYDQLNEKLKEAIISCDMEGIKRIFNEMTILCNENLKMWDSCKSKA